MGVPSPSQMDSLTPCYQSTSNLHFVPSKCSQSALDRPPKRDDVPRLLRSEVAQLRSFWRQCAPVLFCNNMENLTRKYQKSRQNENSYFVMRFAPDILKITSYHTSVD